VNEQKAEPISGETGFVGPVAPHSSVGQGEPTAVSMQGSSIEGPPEGSSASVDAPKLVPEQGAGEMSQADPLKAFLEKADADKADASKADASKADASKADASKPDASNAAGQKAGIPRMDASLTPGRVMIMSAGERSWSSNDAGPSPESGPSSAMFGKRRLGALAAVVALAAVAGALGGAVATASLGHFGGTDTTASVADHALEASVARLDADIQALKAGADHASRLGMTQFNKTSERLDKVEKAQLEPAAKLAKLSEAVEKLHAAPPVAAAAAATQPAAAKETTGSISPPAAAAPKVEVERLPTVEGWSLRDVANGGALIEGRQGIFEVYAGDPVPGLGRIDAIRKQDGHWVVVTSRGLIVAR
jgi:hypothetical protein